jgi:hypothetical protein
MVVVFIGFFVEKFGSIFKNLAVTRQSDESSVLVPFAPHHQVPAHVFHDIELSQLPSLPLSLNKCLPASAPKGSVGRSHTIGIDFPVSATYFCHGVNITTLHVLRPNRRIPLQ